MVQDYIANTEWCYTSSEMHTYLELQSGMNVWKRSIIIYLRKVLNKSYKRWSSRPTNYQTARIDILKRIFAIEFANVVDKNSLLINIDEVHFSRTTKSNYSWLDRGVSCYRRNISFVGSLSLIWAITSQGGWFATNLTQRNNSDTFVDFISKMDTWIEEELKVSKNNIIILLDNCSIHKSKKSIEKLNSLGWKTIFIAPYSPEWVPIELFFNTMKWKLKRHCKNQIVHLSKEEGFRNIQECLATFSQGEVISYWRKALEVISSWFSI